MGIIGYGGTGRYTARVAKSFGMEIVAVKRSLENVEGREWVDELVPLDRWHEALGRVRLRRQRVAVDRRHPRHVRRA